MLRARRIIELALLSSAAALYFKNVDFEQPFIDLVLLALVVAVLLAPSLLLVHFTMQWKLWCAHVATALPWLLLGWLADLDCTDCGFALLIPINMFVVQVILVALGFAFPALRRSDHRYD